MCEFYFGVCRLLKIGEFAMSAVGIFYRELLPDVGIFDPMLTSVSDHLPFGRD
jgi:hypothetical protein